MRGGVTSRVLSYVRALFHEHTREHNIHDKGHGTRRGYAGTAPEELKRSRSSRGSLEQIRCARFVETVRHGEVIEVEALAPNTSPGALA